MKKGKLRGKYYDMKDYSFLIGVYVMKKGK